MRYYKSSLSKIKSLSYAGFIYIFSLSFISNASAQQQVYLEVEGLVQRHCAFDELNGQSQANFTSLSFKVNPDEPRANSRTEKIGLGLTCNAPFTMTISSTNGGLLNDDIEARSIGGDFTNQIAYRTTVNMTTEDPSTPVALSCGSQEMAGRSGSCIGSSGSNAAVGQGAGIGEVAITLSEITKIPVQGRYQDTVFLALTLQ